MAASPEENSFTKLYKVQAKNAEPKHNYCRTDLFVTSHTGTHKRDRKEQRHFLQRQSSTAYFSSRPNPPLLAKELPGCQCSFCKANKSRTKKLYQGFCKYVGYSSACSVKGQVWVLRALTQSHQSFLGICWKP